MLNRTSNYSVIPNTNEHYSAKQSFPIPRQCASPPSGRRFNKVPARLRQTGSVLDLPHINATVSYRTTKDSGYQNHHHHHHGHHSNHYQTEKVENQQNKGYEAKYKKYKYSKYKYDKYKSKASKRETKSTATGSIVPNGEDSDDSHGSGGKGHSHDVTVSTKRKFGLRKVSCYQRNGFLGLNFLTCNRHETSISSYPGAAHREPHPTYRHE